MQALPTFTESGGHLSVRRGRGRPPSRRVLRVRRHRESASWLAPPRREVRLAAGPASREWLTRRRVTPRTDPRCTAQATGARSDRDGGSGCPRAPPRSRDRNARGSRTEPRTTRTRALARKGRDERRENAGGAGRAGTRGVEAWPPPVSATSSRTPGVAAPTPLPLALSRAVRSPRDGCCSAPARVSRTNSPAPPLSVLRSSFSRHPLGIVDSHSNRTRAEPVPAARRRKSWVL